MVVFDTSILLPLVDPRAPVPRKKGSNQPIEFARERLQALLATLDRRREAVLVPTPVLAELLVHARNAPQRYLEVMQLASNIRIGSFAERAAVECALLFSTAHMDRRSRIDARETRARTNFDNQIIAIAKVERAGAIYTADDRMEQKAADAGLEVLRLEDEPLPEEAKQPALPFGEETAEAATDRPLEIVGPGSKGSDEDN